MSRVECRLRLRTQYISVPWRRICRAFHLAVRRVSWTGSKKKKKKKDGSKPDYYKLLGLQNERWMATENDIKLGASS